jgi:hypothetical protein
MLLAVPDVIAAGETEVTLGAAIVKVRVFEATWLTESVTLIVALPAVVKSAAGTETVMDVAVFDPMVSVVVAVGPTQLTIVLLVGKPVPVRVRVAMAPWPATAEVVLRFDNTGFGLIVNVWFTADEFEPLFVTPICAEPAAVSRLLGITAVREVALTKVVPRLVGLPEQKLHQVATEPLAPET